LTLAAGGGALVVEGELGAPADFARVQEPKQELGRWLIGGTCAAVATTAIGAAIAGVALAGP
jgi:hypothetical protein